MAISIEWRRTSEGVLCWMCRIEMRTGHKVGRNLLCGRMRASVLQQLWQHVGVRAFRAAATGRRYRLKNFDSDIQR